MRRSIAILALIWPFAAPGGHDSIEVDPAMKRHAGQVVALDAPDAEGRIYSFRARRLPAAADFAPDELRGWRLTLLAGARFSHAFEVQGNSGTRITVSQGGGPLNGIAPQDLFVLENVPLQAR